MRRIGIFGGSFDPIHHGHLILAETCREVLRLDRVLIVPAATSPLKPHGPIASDLDRLEMCRLATADNDSFVVDPIELERGGVSFTIDTVRSIAAREPVEIYLVVGSDAVAQFAAWKEPAELLRMVQLAVVQRAGDEPVDFTNVATLLDVQDRENFQPTLVPIPLLEISSTELRRRVAAGRSIRYQTPPAVEGFISSKELYSLESSQ